MQLLRAAQELQQFRLVDFDADAGLVSLTSAGARTATVVKGLQIRTDATRLLGEAPT